MISPGGIHPHAQSRASPLRMMQSVLLPILKSDAQGNECSGLNCFLCSLAGNIFWVERERFSSKTGDTAVASSVIDVHMTNVLVSVSQIVVLSPC